MADRDDDSISLQETLVEKSERMEREHSARREVRKREERVRRIKSEQSERSRPRTDASSVRRLPARPREAKEKKGSATQVSPPPLASRAHRTDEARAAEDRSVVERSVVEPSAVEPSAVEQAAPPRPKLQKDSQTAESDVRKVRISDPFPPLEKKKAGKSKGAKRSQASVDEAALSSFDLLAIELELLIGNMRMGWRNMGFGDRVTLISAIFVAAGVLMPWMSDPSQKLQIGLNVGGLVHLALALGAVRLCVAKKNATTRVVVLTARELDEAHRRRSLWIVLLGFSTTLFSVYLFVVYGLSKSTTWPVTFHFGLYWTLAMSTGLTYGGFARFRS